MCYGQAGILNEVFTRNVGGKETGKKNRRDDNDDCAAAAAAVANGK
jgi:hypothetical protein